MRRLPDGAVSAAAAAAAATSELEVAEMIPPTPIAPPKGNYLTPPPIQCCLVDDFSG